MSRKEVVSLVILILVIMYGVYRYINRSYTTDKSQFLLNTIVKISGTCKTKDINHKIDMVFEYIKSLESDLNEYKEGGWLWNLNNSDDYQYKMNPDAYQILCLADSLYRYSEGKFDITIKPVFDIWEFDSINPVLPDKKILGSKLTYVGFDKIKYDKNYIYKPTGMQLTFGSLAKGYIIDKAKDFMLSNNITKGYIDCHSSMTFWGNNLLPEIVGIQHPRNINDIIATLQLKDISVGTSGDYQQYFDIAGKRYHHILNAKTGFPVDSIYSITVLNKSAFIADGLSTMLFLQKPEKALNLIKKFPNSEVVIYYEENNTIMSLKTNGIKAYIQNEKN